MVKTKREYILGTCFLSGAAAIISLVSLGTQGWVTSTGIGGGVENVSSSSDISLHFGLFGGVLHQKVGVETVFELTMVCLVDKNICALLCGNNLEKNLERLYNGQEVPLEDRDACPRSSSEVSTRYRGYVLRDTNTEDLQFINTGVWVCTIIFICLSAVMGLFSAGLAVWNTASNPYQVYFSVFGMYIYNGIAFFSILLAVILWGAMFVKDLLNNDIPTYHTLIDKVSTKGLSQLSYSFWINLASIFLYASSIALLYVRDYLISREPERNLPVEDNVDAAIYLY